MYNKRFVILGRNNFEYLQALLYSWVRNFKVLIVGENFPSPLLPSLKCVFFIRRYIKRSVEEYRADESTYKGLWPKANSEVIELTIQFYDREIADKIGLITFYNNMLRTKKFEAYIKKKISYEVFDLLKGFHAARSPDLINKEILLIKNPLNEFIARYAEDKHKVMYKIKWIWFPQNLFFMLIYYKWLFRELIHRGFAFNKERKEYKLSKEAAWRFDRSTLKDDIAIDGERFKKRDILMLQFFVDKESGRSRAFKLAKEKGYDIASLPDLKVNVNKNIFNVLFFYFIVPLKTYFKVLLNGMGYLLCYIFQFHRECFPVEMLMNLYRIRCHMSVTDCDDIATTIILNKYGTKNTLFHWSDQSYFDFKHNFKGHDVFFTWGDIYDRHYPTTSFIGKKINIGCIFKKGYSEALKNKGILTAGIANFKSSRKTIAFFDTIPDVTYGLERLYLECLQVIKKLCGQNKEINVLFKPKLEWGSMLKTVLGCEYENIWTEIIKYENFIYLDPEKWSPEAVIAISDVCVSVGMNTTSTIALVCGKNALYLDDTDTYDDHPFYKYRGTLVLNGEKIIDQIYNILEGRFDYSDVLSEEELCRYDAFRDNDAVERMCRSLYDLILYRRAIDNG